MLPLKSHPVVSSFKDSFVKKIDDVMVGAMAGLSLSAFWQLEL